MFKRNCDAVQLSIEKDKNPLNFTSSWAVLITSNDYGTLAKILASFLELDTIKLSEILWALKRIISVRLYDKN